MKERRSGTSIRMLRARAPSETPEGAKTVSALTHAKETH